MASPVQNANIVDRVCNKATWEQRQQAATEYQRRISICESLGIPTSEWPTYKQVLFEIAQHSIKALHTPAHTRESLRPAPAMAYTQYQRPRKEFE